MFSCNLLFNMLHACDVIWMHFCLTVSCAHIVSIGHQLIFPFSSFLITFMPSELSVTNIISLLIVIGNQVGIINYIWIFCFSFLVLLLLLFCFNAFWAIINFVLGYKHVGSKKQNWFPFTILYKACWGCSGGELTIWYFCFLT